MRHTPEAARITLKSPQEIEKMRRAGRIVAEVLDVLVKAVEPGMRTRDLDTIARREIAARGGIPSFLGYLGYPACICTSLNEEIVHGIPGPRVLREGDVLSLDCGAIYEGYHGDSAVTIGIGAVSAVTRQLIDTTREALERGIAAAVPGARMGDVSYAIQSFVEARGMNVVREYVGHGIGREMHEEPAVPNYGTPNRGIQIRPGLALAIEPMVTLGDWHTQVAADGWTVSTLDGSLSAHFENSIIILEGGPEVLTSRG
ncbi:MAG: type I methionyl aminopeptidase [Chloroflexi bacterium]|nr:type I methionyl aminopeptidase [Chloroflexota bacterium]